ncbi:MAG: DUF305 domain-containing protein [Chloroflexota bacterium]|nr:DUF305 domain-containing protein [Chloroflexota bacterium]
MLAGLLGGVVGAMLFDGDDFPADDSADAGFLRDMSTHHAQAVRMASYAYRVSDDEAIRTLAYDILTTQQGQIGIMTGWLDVWGLSTTSADGPMAWMGHEMSGPMPGMATAEELANLESLTGPELDREFLRLMIAHHEGGVGMAEAGVELGESDQVKDLAGAILETQGGETAYMKQMLAERGG